MPVAVGMECIWVDFDTERIGTRPPLLLALEVLTLIGLAIGFSFLVANRMTRPLLILVRAVE